MEIKILLMNREFSIERMRKDDLHDSGINKMSPEEQYEMEYEWYLNPENVREESLEIHPNSIGMIQSLPGGHCRIFIPSVRSSYTVPMTKEEMANSLRSSRKELQKAQS